MRVGVFYFPTDYGIDIAELARALEDRGFDSLFVRGGHCGVRNNEMVVWNTEQIRLTHLCEFR